VAHLIQIPRRILLSGCPILNKPIDLFHQLHLVAPDVWRNFLAFRDRYEQGYYHPHFSYWIPTGSKNIEELSQRIKPFILRKSKAEILKDLPPKIYNKIPIQLNGEHLTRYNLAMDDFKQFLLQFTDLTRQEILRRLRGEAFAKIQAIKQICSDYKVQSDLIKKIVENILENNPDDKVVIYSQYRKVVKDLHRQFPNSVVMHGQMEIEARGKSVAEFQNNPKVKVFIATIQTGGMGITLTRGSHVIFCDLMWNPSDMEQSVDRLHRIGTHKAVNIFYVLGKDTIDTQIYSMIESKKEVIDQIIDGRVVKQPVNIYNEFMMGEIRRLKDAL